MTALHPHIPVVSHPSIFPLYNPTTLDVAVFWEIPSQQCSGHLLISGVTLGAGHAALKGIIEDAEGLKVKRSIYAETRKEKEEILYAIRASEWNAEMDPIVVSVPSGVRIGHEFSRGYVMFFNCGSSLMLRISASASCR
jgi:trafficking protein particle complex subunit 8